MFPKFVEYQGHDRKGVVAMMVTHDDMNLITAGVDGTIVIFEIRDKEARGTKLSMREGFPKFSDEVLVTKDEMTQLETDQKARKREKEEEEQITNQGPNLESEDAQLRQLREEL